MEGELSPEALVALRRLAGSLGAIALGDDPGRELVELGYARPIGSGYVVTARGVAALNRVPAEPTRTEAPAPAEAPAPRLF